MYLELRELQPLWLALFKLAVLFQALVFFSALAGNFGRRSLLDITSKYAF